MRFFKKEIQRKFLQMKKSNSRDADTVKSHENKQNREKLNKFCCNDFCEYECVLETVAETDPECCAAHRLGFICCCCFLIRRIRKAKKKAKVGQDENHSDPVVMEQPKPQHRHTI